MERPGLPRPFMLLLIKAVAAISSCYTTSHLKKKILVQNQGGFRFQTAGILKYVEDLEFESNAEFGPKDFFEIACT
jgi:hypothetical protein